VKTTREPGRELESRAQPQSGAGPATRRAPSLAIDSSPRMVAQQKLIAATFGPAVQPSVPPAQFRAGSSPTSNRTGLPDGLKSGIESLSGLTMDHVKVNYNSAQPAQLNALAYAQGSDIHLAPGQEHHLPHEAWHVVQQAQGRVAPTLQVRGVGVNDDAGLEHEADRMGQAALASEAPNHSSVQRAPTDGVTGSPTVQRTIRTAEPITDLWNLGDYENWLATRQIHTNDLGLVAAPPTNVDVTSMALHQLRQLFAEVAAHDFRTRDALHAELIVRTRGVVQNLVTAGVQVNDLDVAVAMYARLDGHEGEEAILHKLDWHELHNRQYQQLGTAVPTATTSGLVYGPWRAGLLRQPDNGMTPGAENVHTMPLNVAWLLACCHHMVTFRLYVPVTERALYREAGAGMVIGAGGQQRKLSALGRELMALLATGLYTAGPAQHNDQAPQGFETTIVLSPTAAAAQATAAQLTVANNLTQADVRHALFTTAGVPEPDDAVVTTTVAAGKTIATHENTVRGLYSAARRTPAGAYALGRLLAAEAAIVQVTRETVPAMRTRVLGGAHPTLAVTFECYYATQFGQNILVVGNHPTLGDWDRGRAELLTYHDANSWRGPVQLPDVWAQQPIKYKYLLETGGSREWETGNNHLRVLPAMGAAAPLYSDNWGQG